MTGSMRSGLLALLAWMAIGACVTELMELRQVVVAMVEDTSLNWISGAMSYVYEGFDDTGN